ncbi:MAG: aldehyde dehydrogenase family protein [Armatimonadetes bacterium]|nr:aldehyde dehydrogenase family protein [Armatimonadota bacterium]
MTVYGLIVHGEEVEGSVKAAARAPYDGRVLGEAWLGAWADMDRAIGSSVRAYSDWKRTARRDRATLLRRVAQGVRDQAEDLAFVLTHEVGKPVTWSRGEVARTALTFDLAADLLTAPSGEVLPTDFDPRGDGHRCTVERFPVGPVLAITPYNWPYNLAAHKIAPALAAGNTVLLKPSKAALLSSRALVRAIHDAGCPPGVLNLVPCDPETAEKAVQDPRVRCVSFTGSDVVGWRLKKLASEKPVTLELGGDASAVVFPDADLDWTLGRLVAGGFGYAGQICISIQHVRVHREVYDEVRDRLTSGTRACPAGDPALDETVCGPMIDGEAADRVEAWVDSARGGGATVLAGGRREGNVLKPTLVSDVPPGTELACKEVFGPVLTLTPFESVDEAVAQVDGSSYGIHCGVFTKDLTVAERFYQEVDTGGVVVGDYPTLRFDNMPYGGVKKSGFGREGVRSGYESMTVPKVLLTRLV